MKEALGEEKFKVIQKYDIIQVSSVTKQCQTVDRFCRKNLHTKQNGRKLTFHSAVQKQNHQKGCCS